MPEKFINTGDIVVLSPEYAHLYDKNTFYGSYSLINLLFTNPYSLKDVCDSNQFFSLLLKTPGTFIRSLYGGKFFDPSLSDKGDYLFDETLPHNKVQLTKTGLIKQKSINHTVFAYLIEFRKSLQSKNVKLFVAFPYIPSDTSTSDCYNSHSIYRQLSTAGFDTLYSPEECKLSSHYFYDTAYHLNFVGRIIRTDALAIALHKKAAITK
jgi:hypothetical protein